MKEINVPSDDSRSAIHQYYSAGNGFIDCAQNV
jgi:hypothetical protein